jgi:hypothetical protein
MSNVRSRKIAGLLSLVLVGFLLAPSAAAPSAPGRDKGRLLVGPVIESIVDRSTVGDEICLARVAHAYERCRRVCGSRGIMFFDPGACGAGSKCVCNVGDRQGPPIEIP